MASMEHLRAVASYNCNTLKRSPLAELSGALGDLGTLLPLTIALTLVGCIDLSSTLVFSGLTNIFTGVVYGIPLPVQPMKAIAATAISQSFGKPDTAAAGLATAAAVLLLAATGLLRWLNRVVPVPVVRGIQVGAGLSLVISAGSSLIKPLNWTRPAWDNRVWAVMAFLLLVLSQQQQDQRRMPYALVVFVLGIILAAFATAVSPDDGPGHAAAAAAAAATTTLWHPTLVFPSIASWRTGIVDGAIPQLPLTTLNSIIAVVSLCSTLFPCHTTDSVQPRTPSTTSIGFSIAISNLVGCWFGAMPVCHGSGGLAGQYRFGARSGASVVVLGSVKLLLGLFVGNGIVPFLQRFPKSLLGVMVLAAGVELAKVGEMVNDRVGGGGGVRAERESGGSVVLQDGDDHGPARLPGGFDPTHPTELDERHAWMVMLITAAGCLAFKNDAVGFIAGLVWYWASMLPGLIQRTRFGKSSIRLGRNHDRAESHDGFLDT